MTASYQTFTAKQQKDLWRQCKKGSLTARTALIEANYGLVGSVAKRFSYAKEDYEELFQCGVMGLIKSVDGFQPQMGTPFSAYAVPFIWGEMMRFSEERQGQKRSRQREILVKRVLKNCFAYFILFQGEHFPLFCQA